MATTGEASFRILSAASAQDLTLGSATAASLDQARGTALYHVALQAGDKLFLDGRSVTNGAIGWRLVDPYGDLVASSSALANLIAPFTVSKSGSYLLLLEGDTANDSVQTVAYDFSLNRVPDVASTLTVGNTTSGTITTAGQATVYTFTLATAARIVFDSQTNSAICSGR